MAKHDGELEKRLMDAVSAHDLASVHALLGAGADPNREHFLPDLPLDAQAEQPTTPLKMVMFRISDCLLEDRELRSFARIAELLLLHGAAAAPAMAIAEARYGAYDATAAGPFAEVWHIVAGAASEQ